jgi:hypothetical protein
MFVAAIVLAVIGFVLLVLTVQSHSDIWSYLLVLDAIAGLALWGIDYARKRRLK